MTIAKKIVLDEHGKPTEVIMPYDQFVELSEIYGWDLNEAEQSELKEALADSVSGNRSAFVSASDV
ncbi:MAG: hypothetical protein ABJQ29_11045 [Luteolibacter sp.]